MQMLLEKGDMNALDRNGLTPIMLASKYHHLEVVKVLLTKEDIDLITRDREENTVMHHACAGGNKKIIELLMAQNNGPDLDARNSDHDTPLVAAARNYQVDVVRMILSEMVPSSNVEKSLTKFAKMSEKLDKSVRVLPSNLALEVIRNTSDDDLIEFVLQYKDEFNL